ncbi:MAG: hypothetical protein WC710_15095 [Gallionella sp.]|jgi:hypothetical protein
MKTPADTAPEWLVARLRSLADCDARVGEPLGKCMREAADEIERLRVGYDRYEVARRMSPQQWADAWRLNISTGKPFDEIIDQLRPFMIPKDTFNP